MQHEIIKMNESGSVYLKTYIIDDPLRIDRKRPTVVICPGGAYRFCSEREAVPVENSLLMASALAKAKVPCELHIFPRGTHGLSLSEEWAVGCDQEPVEEPRDWMRMAVRWIRSL